jgi:hypothetical protein
LQQAAGLFVPRRVAAHQLCPDPSQSRHRPALADEGSLQILRAEVDHFRERQGSAYAARLAVD